MLRSSNEKQMNESISTCHSMPCHAYWVRAEPLLLLSSIFSRLTDWLIDWSMWWRIDSTAYELATADKVWLLVPLLVLHLFLLWLIYLVNCDLEHLDFTLNVEESIAFLFLWRCLHLGHNLSFNAGHSWLETTWTRSVIHCSLLAAHVWKTGSTRGKLLLEATLHWLWHSSVIATASSPWRLFLYSSWCSHSALTAVLITTLVSGHFSRCVQTSSWSRAKAGCCSATQRPLKTVLLILVHDTNRVACCADLSSIRCSWREHALCVLVRSPIMCQIWYALHMHVLLNFRSLSQNCILACAE